MLTVVWRSFLSIVLTLYNVCAVPWGRQHRGGVQYRGGYHEYRGGYQDKCGDFLSTVGDIMSTVRGYLEYHGGIQYCGGISRCTWGIS